MILPLEIKNQGKNSSDMCMACAISSIAEPYVGEPCEEAYLYAAAAQYRDPRKRGLSPGKAIEAVIEYGVLPKRFAPYSAATHDREFLANWENWKGLERFAVKPFRSSRRIRGFDNAMRAINGKTTLLAGMFWQGEWDKTPFIDSTPNFHRLSPHAVRLVGVKDDRIVIQNSRGSDVGDGGLWYISREPFERTMHSIHALSEESRNWLQAIIDNL